MAQMKTIPSGIFLLPEILWAQIQNHLQANLPEEACGLIGGTYNPQSSKWIANCAYPVENILHSPSLYYMDGRAQLAAFEQIDEAGMDLIAIFHSHPNGPAFPSETDRIKNYYRDAIQLICYLMGNDWNCRAYRFIGNEFHEIKLLKE